jgi:anti-anti-sigma factor
VSSTESPSGPGSGPVDVEIKRVDSTIALLIPRGGLDGEQLEYALRLSIETLVAAGVTGLVVDLRCYAILDSSGLGALVASHGDVAETSGVRLVLTGVGQSLHRTLSRSMLLQVLPVYETVERASAALRA